MVFLEVGNVLLDPSWSLFPLSSPHFFILGEFVVDDVGEEATDLEVINASVITANELFVGWEKFGEVGHELVELDNDLFHLLVSFGSWFREEGRWDVLSEEVVPEMLAKHLTLVLLHGVLWSQFVDCTDVIHDGGGLYHVGSIFEFENWKLAESRLSRLLHLFPRVTGHDGLLVWDFCFCESHPDAFALTVNVEVVKFDWHIFLKIVLFNKIRRIKGYKQTKKVVFNH